VLFRDALKANKAGMSLNAAFTYKEPHGLPPSKGQVFIEAMDARTGEIIEKREIPNLIVRDAGILVTRLLRDSTYPVPGVNGGLRMLAVGTGATGNLLSPDAPQDGQRMLNNELFRKVFASTTYRDGDGLAVAYETNVCDFTTTFSESEAVGPWNEMALLAPFDLSPTPGNPIVNGPDNYDPTIDVTGKDLMLNYLTYSVISKPNTAIFTVTWRISA